MSEFTYYFCDLCKNETIRGLHSYPTDREGYILNITLQEENCLGVVAKKEICVECIKKIVNSL